MVQQFEQLKRPVVKALDDILGVPFPVLDDGFIRVVDYMGSDESIVQAARVSYGKGTKKVSQDRGLIRYLLRHMHSTPFEMCEIKLHVRVPMDCWRQWIRHRTANVNEYSTRYSVAIDSAQKTAPDKWRCQSKSNRQGSEDYFSPEEGQKFSEEEQSIHQLCLDTYNSRLQEGMAREQARKDLPLSTYTEAYWKIDLNNLLRFISLRMESNAQLEIRKYAEVIGHEILSKWCPITWEAFSDYSFSAMKLSGIDIKIINAIAAGDTDLANEIAGENGLLEPAEKGLKRNIERGEIEEKLKQLNLCIPWASLEKN
jgi:thymidylate synthase (FAD)